MRFREQRRQHYKSYVLFLHKRKLPSEVVGTMFVFRFVCYCGLRNEFSLPPAGGSWRALVRVHHVGTPSFWGPRSEPAPAALAPSWRLAQIGSDPTHGSVQLGGQV